MTDPNASSGLRIEPETEVEKQIVEVQRRYRVCAGRILVTREAVAETFTDSTIVKTEFQLKVDQLFEPWGNVLMVGERFKPTDYRPELTIGQRVYFSPTGARDIELAVGDEKITVAMVPFEGILLIDDGEKVDA